MKTYQNVYRSGVCIVVLWSGLALMGSADVSGQELQEGDRHALSPPLVALPMTDRGDHVWWEGRVIGPVDAQYLRLRFSDIHDAAAGDYKVVIRGADERQLTTLSPSFFTGAENDTDPLFSHVAVIQVVSKSRVPPGFGFTVRQFVSATDIRGRLTLQSILPTWRPIDQVPASSPLRPYADSVAKLFMGDGATCSGFLVGQNQLLTNYHCLVHSTGFSRAVPLTSLNCHDIRAQFDFNDQGHPSTGVFVRCESVVAGDEPVDYVLLTLAPELNRLAPRKYLRLSEVSAADRQHLVVIHHPAGLATQLTIDCSTFPAGNGVRNLVEHDCSTAPGSSGAPVLTAGGEVVALHSDGAYPDNLTMRDISERLAQGEVFRNKARPAKDIAAQIRPLLVQQ
jgi:hypothetical protein